MPNTGSAGLHNCNHFGRLLQHTINQARLERAGVRNPTQPRLQGSKITRDHLRALAALGLRLQLHGGAHSGGRGDVPDLVPLALQAPVRGRLPCQVSSIKDHACRIVRPWQAASPLHDLLCMRRAFQVGEQQPLVVCYAAICQPPRKPQPSSLRAYPWPPLHVLCWQHCSIPWKRKLTGWT